MLKTSTIKDWLSKPNVIKRIKESLKNKQETKKRKKNKWNKKINKSKTLSKSRKKRQDIMRVIKRMNKGHRLTLSKVTKMRNDHDVSKKMHDFYLNPYFHKLSGRA